ncbi:hypothetical protein V5799_017039 [Amblyomma americanum]|uniref:Uncharacterized protein n=1 Tax=Amblyomma americanum TaxID=6943 RepID=A0AAQ4F4K8_AMBAM
MGQHRPTFEPQQPWSPCDASLALYAQLVSRKCLDAYDEPCTSDTVVAGVIAIVGAPLNVLLFVTAIERRYNFTHQGAVIDRISKYKNSIRDSKEDAADREELVKSTAQVGHQAIASCDRGISVVVAHRPNHPYGVVCVCDAWLHHNGNTEKLAVHLEAIIEDCAGILRLTKTVGLDARGSLTTAARRVTEGAQELTNMLQHLLSYNVRVVCLMMHPTDHISAVLVPYGLRDVETHEKELPLHKAATGLLRSITDTADNAPTALLPHGLRGAIEHAEGLVHRPEKERATVTFSDGQRDVGGMARRLHQDVELQPVPRLPRRD